MLRENRVLETAELGCRLDAELLDEGLAGLPVDLEGLRLTARPVERDHQSAGQALANAMLGDERAQLSDQLDVTTEREVGLDPLFERRQPDLLQPSDGDLRERFVVEVGQRRAAPQREGIAQKLARLPGIARCAGESCLLAQSLEPAQVELIGRQADQVAGRAGLDRILRSERLPQLGDLPLNLRDGRDRRRAGIQVIRESLDRDDAVRAQEQDGERRALLGPAEANGAAIADDLERPKDPELEHLGARR